MNRESAGPDKPPFLHSPVGLGLAFTIASLIEAAGGIWFLVAGSDGVPRVVIFAIIAASAVVLAEAFWGLRERRRDPYV